MSAIAATQTFTSGALELLRDVNTAFDEANKYTGGKSLIDVSKNARVEPIMIVDGVLVAETNMVDIAHSLQSIFAGYYLQAIEHISTVNGCKVAEKLAPLNPNRKIDLDMLTHNYHVKNPDTVDDWKMWSHNYTYSLPKNSNRKNFGMEAYRENNSSLKLMTTRDLASMYNFGFESDKDKKNGIFKDVTKSVTDVYPLSVGKLYTIKLKDNNQTLEMNIAIRVLAKTIPTSSLVSIFTFNNVEDMDLVERFHGWRSGRLEFINDLILCNDIVDNHRKNLITDKTGIYKEILSRQNNGIAAGLLEKNPSLAIASNLAIVDSTTMEMIEMKMGGKISNPKVRREVFNTTNMMILAVVDRGYEQVTFYHRGIAMPSEMSFNAIKASNKGNGPDVGDILKSFLSGKAPTL